MSSILHTDIVNAANDLKRIVGAMRRALDAMAVTARRDQKAQFVLLSAAAELAGDKVQIIEGVTQSE